MRVLATEETLLVVLVFLEWPRLCGLVGDMELVAFTCPSAVLFCPAVGATISLGDVGVLVNGR